MRQAQKSCYMFCLTYIKGLLVQTDSDKLFEGLGEVSHQLRRRVLWYEEEDSHGMKVCVWRLSCSQFYGSDPQGPNVRLYHIRHTHMHTDNMCTTENTNIVYVYAHTKMTMT